MKNTIKLFVVIALVAIIGFGVASCSGGSDDKDDTTTGDGSGNGSGNSNGDGKGDGSSAGKSNWLWAHEKFYTVTDGVAGNSYEYDITYTSYTDDKHYAYQYIYTPQPVNTRNETAQYTQTYVGSIQVSTNDSRDGNTGQSVQHTTSDSTYTLTYADPSYSSYNSTTSSTSDTTLTQTYVYDNDSGLTKSGTQQQTGTSSTTSNGNTTTTPSNSSLQYSNTIELLSTEGSAKTYKHYISSVTSNGTSVDISTQGYDVYKIQNGITLEIKGYTAAGVLSSTTTYSFPDNATIKSKLPNYTIYNTTGYGSDGSSYTGYSTAEVVSDSNTELRILVKSYSNGKLSSQSEKTYRRR